MFNIAHNVRTIATSGADTLVNLLTYTKAIRSKAASKTIRDVVHTDKVD